MIDFLILGVNCLFNADKFTVVLLFRAAGLPAQAPESEAQAAVRVQTDGDLPRRVELTLQFDGATQGTGGSVRHLEDTQGQMMH